MKVSRSTANPTVLLVEDNDLDAEKVARAFARLGVVRPVTRARDGLEALETLRGACLPCAPSTRYVVLLDLNMPRMNGLEFLEQLRADPEIAATPVFVLTTSGREADVAAAHRHHIAGYMVKPHAMEDMLETLRAVSLFWTICHHPHPPSSASIGR